VGSSKVEKSDVRVVAATNMNMVQAVEKGRFREDLYYRLNSVPIRIPPLRQRKEDIPLLFHKFATDFAEKYMIPPINLTNAAKEMLMDYRWPGNIRQLKNIAEQISIIEQERVITPEILKRYLPTEEVGMVPVRLFDVKETEQKTFANEREILYQVLFDMKKDIMDLKQVVATILTASGDKMKSTFTPERARSDSSFVSHDPASLNLPFKYDGEVSDASFKEDESKHEEEIQEATEYEERTLSLEDVEKDMIVKALERHNGKRKPAAHDLKISERTLYRKIKEYKLENL